MPHDDDGMRDEYDFSTMAGARPNVRRLLEIALGALADIAHSEDMTLTLARNKAKRIYNDVQQILNR